MEDSFTSIGRMMRSATSKIKESASDFMDRSTPLEKNLREATQNTNWGCATSILAEIARATFDYNDYYIIMRCVWESLADKPSKWRRIFKTLSLLEYLIRNGSERVAEEGRDSICLHRLRTLQDFHFSEKGIEKGTGVRQKAKEINDLLTDPMLLKSEREKARRTRDKFVGMGAHGERSGPGFTYSANFDQGTNRRMDAPYDPQCNNTSSARGSNRSGTERQGVLSSSSSSSMMTNDPSVREREAEHRRAQEDREKARRQRERQRARARARRQRSDDGSARPPRRRGPDSSDDDSSSSSSSSSSQRGDERSSGGEEDFSGGGSGRDAKKTGGAHSRNSRVAKDAHRSRRRSTGKDGHAPSFSSASSRSSSSSSASPSSSSSSSSSPPPQKSRASASVSKGARPVSSSSAAKGANLLDGGSTSAAGPSSAKAAKSRRQGSSDLEWGNFAAAPPRASTYTPNYPASSSAGTAATVPTSFMPDFFSAPSSSTPGSPPRSAFPIAGVGPLNPPIAPQSTGSDANFSNLTTGSGLSAADPFALSTAPKSNTAIGPEHSSTFSSNPFAGIGVVSQQQQQQQQSMMNNFPGPAAGQQSFFQQQQQQKQIPARQTHSPFLQQQTANNQLLFGGNVGNAAVPIPQHPPPSGSSAFAGFPAASGMSPSLGGNAMQGGSSLAGFDFGGLGGQPAGSNVSPRGGDQQRGAFF